MDRRVRAGLVLLAMMAMACGEQSPPNEEESGSAALLIEPSTVTLAPEAGQAFTAIDDERNPVDVVWSVLETNGGRIDANGVYLAPPHTGAFTVVATSRADASLRATAKVTVAAEDRQTVSIRIRPGEARVPRGQSFEFEAEVTGTGDHRVEWQVLEPGGGSIDASGTYTAPDTDGTYTVRATSLADRDAEWPWVDPTGESDEARLKVLPAKARYDAMTGN